MTNVNEKFWLDDPSVLLTHFNLIIKEKDPLNVKLNILTRYALIITVLMYLCEYEYYYIFLGISMLFIFSMKIVSSKNKENFTIPYTNLSGTPMTTIPPLFAEEWQSPPPIYDLVEDLTSK